MIFLHTLRCMGLSGSMNGPIFSMDKLLSNSHSLAHHNATVNGGRRRRPPSAPPTAADGRGCGCGRGWAAVGFLRAGHWAASTL